jgi:gliding motility-associated-like protein
MLIRKQLSVLILTLIFALTGMAQSGAYDFTANVTDGCDSVKVKFTFNSTATVDTITDFAWDFGNGEASYVRDPDTVVYNMPGTYSIYLLYGSSATNLLENDPIIKSNYINIYPTIPAGFTYSDTMEIGYYAISFRHNDYPLAIAGIYEWNFGDGTGSDQRNTFHNYAGPGSYTVSLKVSTVIGCADSIEQIVTLTVPPGLPEIIPSDTFGCGEARVKFTLGNVDTDTITSISWDFGNGSSSNLVDPDTVVYNIPGYYDVGVVINGDINHRVVDKNLIHVQLLSRADFSYVDTVTYDTYVFEHSGITDTAAAYNYLWDIGGVGTRTGRRELVKFPAPDTSYLVKLTVSDNFGCLSSSEVIIYVFEKLQVPNVFTPNDDGINDFFEISSNGSVPLSIRIFSRTGTLVYKAEGSMITWDGKTSWGIKLNEGIYYYVLDAIGHDPDGRFHKTGFVYLYR